MLPDKYVQSDTRCQLFVGTLHTERQIMSTILEEGIGFGGKNDQNTTAWDRVKEKYPVKDPLAPYNTAAANFPSSAQDEFKSDLSPRPYVTNLDPLLKELKQSREGTDPDVMKHTVPQKVSVTIDPPINGITEEDVQEIVQKCEESQEPTLYTPTVEKKKSLSETKKMIENFRDNLAKYPKHISYEGSTVLCVLLSMKEEAHTHVNNLPSVDYQTIRAAFPQEIAVNYFTVKFDENKDFVIIIKVEGKDNVIRTFFNTVAHPRPEDLKDLGTGVVPIEKEGDKISVGGKILMNKKGIKRLIGVEPLKRNTATQEDDESLPKRQPIAGRNAFELRTDILTLAADWVREVGDEKTEDEVMRIAKLFYGFVENKNR